MNKQQKDQVVKALVNFIVRASSKKATPAEVQALPGVINAVVTLFQIDSLRIGT